jgi:aspartyl-tRNA(Asn)/glutamyl-tRNA(Gln) amidotransferase subunit A
MTDTPLWKLSATELRAGYRAGHLRPSTVLEAVIARMAAVDSILNLFATPTIDTARAEAEASDLRHAEGRPLGDFDGVPISIKDNITLAGVRCAWGSRLFLDQVPERDEIPVARLRAQGAVFIGKTNVSEFTMGRGNVSTLAFGTTRNPWNPRLTSGASTGGGAAAVAAGVGPVTFGTDGGGSIRRPAAHNGLIGLKPSTGRVARANGLPQILHDLEVIGPIGRTVADVAMSLAAIEGADPRDRASFGFAPGKLEPLARSQRILYVPRLAEMTVEAPIVDSCARAARALSDMGHTVDTGPAPFDVATFEKYWPMVGAAGVAWLVRGHDWRGNIGDAYPPMIEKGDALSAGDYITALMAFRHLYEELAECFGRYDFIMTPSAGAMPWTAEEFGPPYHRAFTGFVNAAGLPAVSIPCDPAEDGLPIGFQVIAPFAADWALLSLAEGYEAAHPWADRWPAL